MTNDTLINTLRLLGIIDMNDEDIEYLEKFDLDINDLHRRLRMLLRKTKVDEDKINKGSWMGVIAMCKLYDRHKFDKDSFNKFLTKFEEIYPYMYSDKELRNHTMLYNSINYIDRSNPLKIDLSNVIRGSLLFLKINGIETKFVSDIKFVKGYTIPFLKNSTKFSEQAIGYGIKQDDSIETYDISLNGLKRLLDDILIDKGKFKRIYTPSFSTISRHFSEYYDIYKLSNKEYMHLLRLTYILELSNDIDLKKYERLEYTDKNIKNLLLTLREIGMLNEKSIVNVAYSVLEDDLNDNDIKDFEKFLKKKVGTLRKRVMLEVGDYKELVRKIGV